MSNPEKRRGEMGFTLNEIIIVIMIFGAFMAVTVPKYLNLSSKVSLNTAREVCRNLSDTIEILHTDYLIYGTDYDADSVIGNTLLAEGVTVTNNSNILTFVSSSGNYTWTYNPRNGTWPAYLTEDSNSAFP